MATPLKIKDVSGNIQELTTAEENYVAFQVGVHLGQGDSAEVGSLNRTTLGDTVGSFDNTFFNQPVGTHPSTSITTGTTTTTIYQTTGTAAETDSDILSPLMWVDSASQTGFKMMPDVDLNEAVDRYLTKVFTNEYPGSYRIASSSPGGGWSVQQAAFTDTRTDGTSITYNIYRKTSGTAPTAVKPMYVEDSAGGSGIKIKEMNDRQIKFSFGQRAKTRIGNSGIGKHQLRSATAGAPTDPGTWVARGTATDTKQTTSDQVFTRDSTANFQANYTNAYTGAYTTNYTKLSQIDYTRVTQSPAYITTYSTAFTGLIAESFTQPYVANYLKNYTASFTNYRTIGYTSVFINTFNSTPYTSAYENNYARLYTSNYTTNYTIDRVETYTQANYTGNYNRTFTPNYTSNYTQPFQRNYTRQYTGNYLRNYTGDYNRNFTGAYARLYTSNYVTDYAKDYTAPTFQGNPAYQRNYTSDSNVTYERSFEGSDFSLDYLRNYTRDVTYLGNYNRVFDGSYQRDVPYDRTTFSGSFAGALYYQRGYGNEAVVFAGVLEPFYIGSRPFAGPGAAVYYSSQILYNTDYTGPAFFNGRVRTALYARQFAAFFFYLRNVPANYTGERQFQGYLFQNYIGFRYFDKNYTRNVNYIAPGYLASYTRLITYDHQGTQQYVGNYVRAVGFGTNYLGNYIVTYTGGYQRLFTSQFVNNFLTNYVPNYIRNFQASYQKEFQTNYAGNYTRLYAGNYSTNFINYRLIGYLTNYTVNYTNTFGLPYEKAYTQASYQGNYAGNYIGNFANSYQNEFQNTFAAFYEKGYTGTYTRTYTTVYQRQYTGGPYDGPTYENQYTGATYERLYTGIYTGLYTGEYSNQYTGTYTGNYVTDYTGNYQIEYARNFEDQYIQDYLGNFIGNFAGETIDATSETNETYTLYVRIA